MRHDETAIVPYLRGELADAERRAMAAHLAACADCRKVADDFRVVLGLLVEGAPRPPEVHWGRYRAELRERLGRGAARGTTRPRWWPLPLALSGALAAVLVFLAVQAPRDARVADLGVVEETVIGGQLDLLREYSMVERLELLEDLEVIRDLDGLEPVRES
ncbi:MAG: zf-HC2 domain-containing protein [Candidatus Rokubacteria bacterium]|nr:zf-HC2 domain-containing protein [Candidatus Rokubacteria bacterium]